MPNALFNQMNKPSDGGFGNMLSQFQQFRAQFQGNPRAEINKLLQSGRITQAQLAALNRELGVNTPAQTEVQNNG